MGERAKLAELPWQLVSSVFPPLELFYFTWDFARRLSEAGALD